jgi:hypothetical protein
MTIAPDRNTCITQRRRLFTEYEQTHAVEDIESIMTTSRLARRTDARDLIWRSSREFPRLGERFVFYHTTDGVEFECEVVVTSKQRRIPMVGVRITESFVPWKYVAGQMLYNLPGSHLLRVETRLHIVNHDDYDEKRQCL